MLVRASRRVSTRPALQVLSTALATCAALAHPAVAEVCTGFRPARLDLRSTPPEIARPIAALPGEFTGDSHADLVVLNRYIDGFLQDGSISVLRGDLTGSFVVASTQIIDGGATSAAVSDFNEDNKMDAVAVNRERVMIFLGNGTGGFLPRIDILLGLDPAHISVADLDMDGHADLIVTQQYIGQASGRVTVLRGNGLAGFTALAPVAVGQSPLAAVVADFNGDSKPDVVAGSTLSNSVTFLPGLGTGAFGPAVVSNLGATIWYLGAQDLNADTKPDLVVASQTTGMPLIYAKGEGDGRFTFVTSSAIGADTRTPAFCDFDKDGKIDVAVPNAASGSVTIWRSTGSGTFAAGVLVGTDPGPSSTATADLNSDGFCDVATANEGSDSVSVLLGGLNGSLGAPGTPTGPFPLGGATADFNNDGRIDVAVVSRDDDALRIFLGDGEGGLSQSQMLATGESPGAVASGHFNADGAADLVVANQGVAGDQTNDTVMVFYNNGSGGFSLGHTLVVGDLPLDVKAFDLSQDSLDDIIVANSRSDKVSVYLAQSLNGFGNVKNFRVGEFQRSLSVDDYSNDGIPDVAASFMGQNSFIVLIGTGTGTFQKGPIKTLPGTAPIDQIVGADINGDLAPDLVAIGQPLDPQMPGELTSLLGTGEGDFFETPFPPVATGIRPEGLAVLDLDLSGALDVVVANRYDNDIMTFIGNGTGQFQQGARYGTGSDPFYLVQADFNNDSRMDVVAVNGGGASVSVLLNNFLIPDVAVDFTLADRTRLTWSPVPGINSYRLYRDQISNLAPDSFGVCFEGSLNVNEFFDPSLPPVNDGYFYLVTTVDAGRESPLGFTTTCLKRPNFHPCGS